MGTLIVEVFKVKFLPLILLVEVRTSLKQISSGWQHMLLPNLYVPFSINGAVTDVQVTHITWPHPPYITDAALWICTGKNLDGPFPLYVHFGWDQAQEGQQQCFLILLTYGLHIITDSKFLPSQAFSIYFVFASCTDSSLFYEYLLYIQMRTCLTNVKSWKCETWGLEESKGSVLRVLTPALCSADLSSGHPTPILVPSIHES